MIFFLILQIQLNRTVITKTIDLLYIYLFNDCTILITVYLNVGYNVGYEIQLIMYKYSYK